jgi:sporulation protein YlmC with PRC-barrel domain
MALEHEHQAQDDATTLVGRVVVDARYTKVGTVTDVIFDEHGRGRRWAVVKPGVLRGEHLVPLENSYVDMDGRLIVALDKIDVKRSPRVRRDHVLTSETRRELRDYYGVAA